MTKIKLCIFDMGGVLIRNFQVKPMVEKFLTEQGIPQEKIHETWKKLISLHGCGHIDEIEMWKRFSSETGTPPIDCSESILGRFFKPTLDIPTVEILQKLKDCKMRLVCGTNVLDSHYRIHNELKQYDIFDKVYASHLMHVQKPAKEFYTEICENENVLPQEVFFTDDFQENIDAARNVGIEAFLYTGAEDLERQLHSLGIF
ncbi:MAG: HAD-IA family hydrolase [Spirochaetales bacterium]